MDITHKIVDQVEITNQNISHKIIIKEKLVIIDKEITYKIIIMLLGILIVNLINITSKLLYIFLVKI
jgi:hypothetical protein